MLTVRVSDHASKQDAIIAAIMLAAGVERSHALKIRDACGHFFGYGANAGREWISVSNKDGGLERVEMVD